MAIANKTQYYALPLPIGSETMEYQDFINDTNNLLDAALHNIATSANQASQAAAAASAGVSAADEKIAAIQTDLTAWNIPALKTEVTSMDARLETVEEDVMTFINPELLLGTTGGVASQIVLKTGGLLIFPSQLVNKSSPTRQLQITKKYLPNDPINLPPGTNFFEVCTLEGNILNLPDNNVGYRIVTVQSMTSTEEGGASFCAYFNGVSTVFGLALTVSSFNRNITMAIVPLGVY